MKRKLVIAFLLLATTHIHAQRMFDSAAYVGFNNARWQAFAFDTTVYAHDISTDEKIVGLSKCWAEAKWNFANFDLVPHLNWDSLYAAFIPRVSATKSVEAYYKTLQQFYTYLNDGHTGVLEPYYLMKQKMGGLYVKIKWVEGKAIVTANEGKEPVYKKLQPGDELLMVNNQPIKEYIQAHIAPYISYSTPQDSIARIYAYELLRGKPGDKVNLTFKNAAGKTYNAHFVFTPFHLFEKPRKLLEFKILPNNIGYLQIHSFNWPEVVQIYDSLFPSIAATNALIIDIRNNGGGNSQNGFEILGTLTDKPFFPARSVLRQYTPVGRAWGDGETINQLAYDWKPYKGLHYNKPIALLTSPLTYSAAEDFTTAFKYISRGKIIGNATGGSTGQPLSFNLPAGGWARVCAKRDYAYSGEEFVGVGILPDIKVDETIDGIRKGKDEVLEKAIAVLQEANHS